MEITREKERVFNSVLALYSKYGIRSITMDDIARELGMSKTELAHLSFGFTGGVREPVDRKAFWPYEMERALNRVQPNRKQIWEERAREVVQMAVLERMNTEKVEQELRLPLKQY